MSFKLRLTGFYDGTSNYEEVHVTEQITSFFVRYRESFEVANVQEKVRGLVRPLSLATIGLKNEQGSIEEYAIGKVVSLKTAPRQTIGFDYVPHYSIVFDRVEQSTVTFQNDLVVFENSLLQAFECAKKRLLTSDYIYSDNGNIPVQGNVLSSTFGSKMEASESYFLHQNNHEIYSIRTTIHQIQTDPNSARINYGVITRDKDVEFTIISGEPYDLLIDEVILPTWMGIELIGADVGTVLPAGGTLTFIVRAYAGLGRNDVHDFFTIKFNSLQQVSIFIDVARRLSPDYLIIPDKGTYKESIEYKTIEFKSLNNVGKTKPLMVNFKYSCKYSVTMHRTDFHKSFLNILKSGAHTVFQHPLWSQVTIMTQEAQNDIAVHCDTAFCDFRIDEYAFIYTAPDEYYLRKIAQIQSDRLIFTRNVRAPKGSFVVPAFPAIVKGTIKTSYTGERYIKGDVEVIEFREGKYYVPY